MTILVEGTLTDPMGQLLPNKIIRITNTNLHTTATYYTGPDGSYSFHLTEGNKHLEVLDTDTYHLAGEITVDISTPSPITIEDLLAYSTPIEIEPVLSTLIKNKITQLLESVSTRIRWWREQVSDRGTSVVGYKRTLANEEDNTRSSMKYSSVNSCKATVTKTDNTYSNGTTHTASTGSSMATNKGEYISNLELGDTYTNKLNINIGLNEIKSEELMGEKQYTNTSSNPVKSTDESYKNSMKESTITIGAVSTCIQSSEEVSTRTDTIGSVIHKSSENASESRIETVSGDYSDTTVITDKSVRKIEVDELNIRDRFEVHKDGVTVHGSLTVNKLLNPDGTEIIPPKDGDTVFQVFQYSETPNGPWHDTIQPNDNWKRENLSVNGVINPDNWSIAYRFTGSDGVAGDTVVEEYEYSPDGHTDWTPVLKTGDKYRRQRIVTNGVAGEWSEPALIAGTDGTTVEVRSEYSIDGIYNWHPVVKPNDKFERRATFENGKQVTPWSDPFPIGKGSDGAQGKPGSGWYTIIGNSGNWPNDTQATSDFTARFGRPPQENDHLFYVDKYPAPKKSTGKRCNSKQGQPITWSTPALAVNGDMLVDGCISARNIVADAITGNHISSSSTIIAGSGSWTAGLNGNDAHPTSYYNNWRIWSGATNPNSAPFRVDKTGKVWASNAVVNGTINADAGYFKGRLEVGGAKGGSKLRILSNKIEVWDNGKLRVRLGNLTDNT